MTTTSPVDCVVWWDVAEGTSSSTYSPGTAVNRAQMASSIARLIIESGGTPPAPTQDHFTDDDGDTHEPAINNATDAGSTGGSATGGYRPTEAVSRAQMASFLSRSLDLLVEAGFAERPGS